MDGQAAGGDGADFVAGVSDGWGRGGGGGESERCDRGWWIVHYATATPAGTLYTVVYQLSDYEVRTEYWSVPATSTTTISAVRTTPGVGAANPAATQQYVNQAVEDLATKAYVDNAVSNVGSGAWVAKTGDTMSGPLTLPGESGDVCATGGAAGYDEVVNRRQPSAVSHQENLPGS